MRTWGGTPANWKRWRCCKPSESPFNADGDIITWTCENLQPQSPELCWLGIPARGNRNSAAPSGPGQETPPLANPQEPFRRRMADSLGWLEGGPDATANVLLDRLSSLIPRHFGVAGRRTLQPVVTGWREVKAHMLLRAVLDQLAPNPHVTPDPAAVGAATKR